MSNFLLINPPIYDFAAYDLWAKPLGLLYISAILKQYGHKSILLDCMDRNHPLMPKTESKEYGCGPYYNTVVEKPEILAKIPRKYKRYGLPNESITKILNEIDRPDYILVSSGMTYWYLGVFEVIRTAKEKFKDTPIILGGNYASLCFDHAKEHSGADFVVENGMSGLYSSLLKLGLKIRGLKEPFNNYPAPDYEGYKKNEYIAIRTSLGCPFNCGYCAIKTLAGKRWQTKSAETVINEIVYFAGQGIENIAFYDDALLYDAKNHIIPILKGLIERKLKVNLVRDLPLSPRCQPRCLAGEAGRWAGNGLFAPLEILAGLDIKLSPCLNRRFSQQFLTGRANKDGGITPPSKSMIPICRQGSAAFSNGVNFHTPNGLHAKYITKEVACLLKEAGFIMPRLSLETVDPKAQKASGGKVSTKEYLFAVENLVDSGYSRGEYCAYTMIGMPGQSLEEVDKTLDIAHNSGAHISLGEYSPIPQTKDWEKVKNNLPYLDPLWQNNSIFPFHPLSYWPKLQALKDKAHRLNNELR
ncbi:MAG: radical SAM protein [Elusimicrobia bacterium]|nr:radical SAM protein [Elusimicrobiota bacterium]